MELEGLVHEQAEARDPLVALVDEPEGASIEGLNGAIGGAEARDHDREDVRVDLPDALDQGDAVHAWHLEIGEDQIEGALFELLDGALRISYGGDFMAGRVQEPRQRLAKQRIVVNDKNRPSDHASPQQRSRM